MNSCEHFRPLLSAFLDNELPAGQGDELRQHLNSCSNCQAEWDSMQDLDARLKSFLKVEYVEQKSDAIQELVGVAGQRRIPVRTLTWIGAIVAIAASVLLISRLLPKGDDGIAPVASVPVVAKLVSATGPIEVLHPDSGEWKLVQQPETCELVAGAKVRTGKKVMCEFDTVGEAKVRMNESAEIVLPDSKSVELQVGQIWCRASKESELQVNAAFGSVPFATFKCPSDSQIQCVAEPLKVTCSTVQPSVNMASCTTAGGLKCKVEPGKTLVLDPMRADQEMETADDLIANSKVWQLPLLAFNTSPGSELFTSMDQLLAPIGRTKARHLNEHQIRALGPAGAIPLLVFANTSGNQQQLALRRTAARLASETADASAIKLLTKLQADPDAIIAAHAKNALARISQEANQKH